MASQCRKSILLASSRACRAVEDSRIAVRPLERGVQPTGLLERGVLGEGLGPVRGPAVVDEAHLTGVELLDPRVQLGGDEGLRGARVGRDVAHEDCLS